MAKKMSSPGDKFVTVDPDESKNRAKGLTGVDEIYAVNIYATGGVEGDAAEEEEEEKKPASTTIPNPAPPAK